MASRRFKKQLFDFMDLTSSGQEGDLWLYGDIVDDAWYDSEVSPKIIKDALDEMGPVSTLNLRINSYGGSCVAGNTIVNLIDNYKRKTGARAIAYIDGIAASMGSGIAMAADYIYMAENAIFMVHKPFSIAIGNADDMAHEKEVLDKVEDTLVSNYMRHFNGTEDEMRQLMADESWLTADEALTYGFCDEVVAPVKIAASAKGLCINGKDFSNEKLRGKFKETKKESVSVFEYDDKLCSIGISQDMFNNLNIPFNTINNIAQTTCNAFYDYITTNGISINQIDSNYKLTTNGTWVYPMDIQTPNVTFNGTFNSEFISKDKAKEVLGKDFSADDILNFAKAGMDADPAANDKAKAYDKLVSAAIDDAIKSGIRAKGAENFNDTKWKKILATLDYEEIIDQKNEWEAEAKIVNKAGKRVSQVQSLENKGDNSAVNIDEYKI